VKKYHAGNINEIRKKLEDEKKEKDTLARKQDSLEAEVLFNLKNST
jgi:hypothetical protein